MARTEINNINSYEVKPEETSKGMRQFLKIKKQCFVSRRKDHGL